MGKHSFPYPKRKGYRGGSAHSPQCSSSPPS
nr:MAG TPA: hypothetical protein [Caudoviricetes sp.]